MTRPLHLFIHPTDDSWEKRHAYGEPLPRLPPNFLLNTGEVSELVFLEADVDHALLYAAAPGWLSTRFPDDDPYDPHAPLPAADTSQPEPESIIVCIHPRPFLDLSPGFSARARELLSGPTTVPVGILSERAHSILGFLYLNVDTASLKATVRASRQAMGTAGDGAPAIPPAITEDDFEQEWRHFLAGRLKFPIRNGEPMGRAASPIIKATPDRCQVGFAVLASSGTHDPSHFYDWMRSYVVDEIHVDAFLELAPPVWPLIPDSLNIPDAIKKTGNYTFPYSALKHLQNRGLTDDQWAQVYCNQKKIYLERLMQRVGFAPVESTRLPFEFNDFDWQNPIQLEAVVEFYMNFDDPWDVLAAPRTAGTDGYRTVDFTPLKGSGAAVNGNTVTLDGITVKGFEKLLEKLWVGRDIITFPGTTPSSDEHARIIDADPATLTLTIDRFLSVASNNLDWYIQHRPVLVLIDSFGGRLRGVAATQSQPDPADPFRPVGPGVLVLDGVDDARMRHIRPGFTTIYLYADAADHAFQPRTYRITSVDVARRIVTLDGGPVIPTEGTAWQLPAGIGGRLPEIADLTRDDDYDGLLFVLHNGEVLRRYRWTSYTSRRRTGQGRSSIRGNRRYLVASFKSGGHGGASRNFCFAVDDEPAYIWGRDAVKAGPRTVTLPGNPDLSAIEAEAAKEEKDRKLFFIFLYDHQTKPIGGFWLKNADDAANTVIFEGEPNFNGTSSSWRIKRYDGVHEARFYFADHVTPDEAPADQFPGFAGQGKRLIRLHYGGSETPGSGSEGCQVSPNFYAMRNFLGEIYQQEHRHLDEDNHRDEAIQQVLNNVTHAANKDAFAAVHRANWDNKIVGTMWLIRPDERPLG